MITELVAGAALWPSSLLTAGELDAFDCWGKLVDVSVVEFVINLGFD